MGSEDNVVSTDVNGFMVDDMVEPGHGGGVRVLVYGCEQEKGMSRERRQGTDSRAYRFGGGRAIQ